MGRVLYQARTSYYDFGVDINGILVTSGRRRRILKTCCIIEVNVEVVWRRWVNKGLDKRCFGVTLITESSIIHNPTNSSASGGWTSELSCVQRGKPGEIRGRKATGPMRPGAVCLPKGSPGYRRYAAAVLRLFHWPSNVTPMRVDTNSVFV